MLPATDVEKENGESNSANVGVIFRGRIQIFSWNNKKRVQGCWWGLSFLKFVPQNKQRQDTNIHKKLQTPIAS